MDFLLRSVFLPVADKNLGRLENLGAPENLFVKFVGFSAFIPRHEWIPERKSEALGSEVVSDFIRFILVFGSNVMHLFGHSLLYRDLSDI